MTILTSVSNGGATLTVHVTGRFDFSVNVEFRRAYEHLDPRPLRFVVDFARTESLDRSALGMLLLLKQHAGGEASSVVLANLRPEFVDALGLAGLGRLFMVA